jgi:hypothetical protein
MVLTDHTPAVNTITYLDTGEPVTQAEFTYLQIVNKITYHIPHLNIFTYRCFFYYKMICVQIRFSSSSHIGYLKNWTRSTGHRVTTQM